MAAVLRVDDRRYGRFAEAFFALKSGLLLGEREGLTPDEARIYRRRYQKAPPTWTTIYGKYRPIQGLLTPHRFTRTGPACPHCPRDGRTLRLSIQWQVAYNGREPDRRAPDLEYWPP